MSEPIPIQDGRGLEQKQNGLGIGNPGDPSYTLTATGGASVMVPQNPQVFEPGALSRIEGHDPAEIDPTLRAHMGDNQLATFYDVEATPMGNLTPWSEMGQANMVYRTDTPTRTVDNNRHLILIEESAGAEIENNSEVGSLTPWPEMPQPYRVYRTDAVARTVDNNRHNILTPKAVVENQRAEIREVDVTNALATGGGKPGQGYPAVRTESVVRRLTPMECERLQGFPDNHTLLRADGKEQANTHRYKQMGNAVAVPVVEWVIAGIVGIQNRG